VGAEPIVWKAPQNACNQTSNVKKKDMKPIVIEATLMDGSEAICSWELQAIRGLPVEG
jgi:hypothetical protein